MSHQDSDYELLTEHLGYPPVSLLDDIINTVNVLADRALDSVEQLLLNQPPSSLGFRKSKSAEKQQQQQDDGAAPPPSPEEAARREIENGTHQLETLLTASIDRNFDKLELYAMQNILTVQPDLRPHVRLAHYEGLDFSKVDEEDNDATVEGITNLRRRVHASQRLNLALQKEKTRNDALLKDLRQILGIQDGQIKKEEGTTGIEGSTFGFLGERTALSSIGSATPITTTTEFAVSQLSSLRSLSSSLRKILPELAGNSADRESSDSSGSSGKKSWRRERAEYVEQASRKYLENRSGLELGEQGEVRDGEYQGEGRTLGRGEVEALEKVAAILGEKGRVEDGDEGDAMDES